MVYYEVKSFGVSLGMTKNYHEAYKWFLTLDYYSRGELIKITGNTREVITTRRPPLFGDNKNAVTPECFSPLQSLVGACKKFVAPKAKRYHKGGRGSSNSSGIAV